MVRSVVPAPPSLLSLLSAQGRERDPHADEWLVEPDLPANVDAARAWLRGRPPAREGQRNDLTFRTAAVLRGFGLSQNTARELILTEYNPRAEPPLDEGEVALAANSAYRNAREPAGVNAPSRALAMMPAEEPATLIVQTRKPARSSAFLDVTAQDAMPDPEWLIEGVLATRGVGLLYGPWGSGKSFVALALALAVANNANWYGRGTTRRGVATYVTGEGTSGMKHRRQAWERHRDLPASEDFYLCVQAPDFANGDELRPWLEELAALHPSLVVIDTVSHAMAGQDENATKDAGAFMRTMYRLRDALHCAVLLVHHTGKDASKGHRGSEEFAQKADTVLRADARGAGVDLGVVLRMTKQKDGEPWRAPITLNARKIGQSLVLVPAEGMAGAAQVPGAGHPASPSVLPVNASIDAQARVHACIGVLRDAPPASLPLDIRTLAREAAHRLMPEGNSEPLVAVLVSWLRHGAPRDGLDSHVAVRTATGMPAAYSLDPSAPIQVE